jgi:Mg2+ and Co2+ transporter CorA
MEFSELVKPLGIVTYACVVITFLVGLFRAKLKLKLAHHKRLAWLAVALASLHGMLVILYY